MASYRGADLAALTALADTCQVRRANRVYRGGSAGRDARRNLLGSPLVRRTARPRWGSAIARPRSFTRRSGPNSWPSNSMTRWRKPSTSPTGSGQRIATVSPGATWRFWSPVRHGRWLRSCGLAQRTSPARADHRRPTGGAAGRRHAGRRRWWCSTEERSGLLEGLGVLRHDGAPAARAACSTAGERAAVPIGGRPRMARPAGGVGVPEAGPALRVLTADRRLDRARRRHLSGGTPPRSCGTFWHGGDDVWPERLRRRALTTGEGAVAAGRDLDSVIQLFRLAERAPERWGGQRGCVRCWTRSTITRSPLSPT